MNWKFCAGAWLFAATSVASPALAAQDQQLSETQLKTIIGGALADTEAKLFRPGAKAENWNKGGVDLRSRIAASPGGLAGNYLVEVDKDGEISIAIFTSAPATTFVPANWKRLWRFGDIDAAGPDSFLEFGNVDGPYFFVVRGTSKRVGDAYCSAGPTGAEIYEAPGSEGATGAAAGIVLLMFEAALEMTAKYTVCEKYEPLGKGFATRYFFEDGRSLPGMDDQGDRLHIIPAVPIGQLLKPTAP